MTLERFGLLVLSLLLVAPAGAASANAMVYVCVTGKGRPPCPPGAVKYSPAEFAASFPPPVEQNLATKACTVMLHGELTQRYFNFVGHTGGRRGGQVWQISCLDLPKPR